MASFDCTSLPTFGDLEVIKLTLGDIITFTYSVGVEFVDAKGITRLTLNGVIQNGTTP